MENKCKHEFRQRFQGDDECMQDDGYYCIYCLLELDTREDINEFIDNQKN